jgi:ribose transport system substrate-binding protein
VNKFKMIVSMVGISAALGACGGSDDGEKKTINRVEIPDSEFKPVALEATIGQLVSELGRTEPQSVQLGVVLKTLTGYWEPVKVGANRAIGELDVPGVVSAPTESTPEERLAQQLEIMQTQRQTGYRGLGIAPMATEIGDSIDDSVDSGIPVVTIDSDLVDSKRQLYIGTINYEAGRTAGETLLRFMKNGEGTVLVLGHDKETDWPDGYQRTKGAADVLEAAGYTVVVRKTTWDDGGVELDVDYLSEALMTADPPAVGMLGMFSAAYRCAMAAERNELTADDVKIVGFDFEPETLAYMRSGLMLATHAQRQYYMGYLVPYVLYGMNVLGVDKTLNIIAPHMVDENRFNAGLDVVDADQLDEYNGFLDSLGVGG